MNPEARVPLGKTRLTVSRLSVGTVPIGGMYAAVDEEVARATLQRSYDLGVRFFDTAPLYGNGVAERRLGEFIASVSRNDVVLSTKVGRLLLAEGPADPTRLNEGFNPFVGAPQLFPVFD